MSDITSKNAVIFGISTDSVESHKGFAEKEKLNFPLLADSEKKMSAAYGVLMPNGMSNRVTFVIGPEGKVKSIDRAVNDQFFRGAKLETRHGKNLALELSDWKAKVGQSVPNFSLPDRIGKTVSLFGPRKKASVVVFLGSNCPVSKAYEARLTELSSNPAYKDVQFIGVEYVTNPPAPRRRNPPANSPQPTSAISADIAQAIRTLDEMIALIDGISRRQAPGNQAASISVRFPVGTDEGTTVADHFGAQNTPTVWVVDSKGIAVYAGAVDDNQNPQRAQKHYLKDALDAVIGGKTVAVSETRAAGCTIRRTRQ